MTSTEDTQKLIERYQRRLQKLKEREAVMGISTPPEVLIEIEDIEAELEKLHKLAAEQTQLQQMLTLAPAESTPIRQPIEARLAEIERLLKNAAPSFDQRGQHVTTQYNAAGDIHIHQTAPAADPAELRRRYLRRLSHVCVLLPLAALGADEGVADEVTLDQVYIELDTTTPLNRDEADAGRSKRRADILPRGDREAANLPALAAARQHPRLVLLGDPGAGKSTFVRQLAGQLARAGLGEAEPLPGFAADLLPVLVTLRHLAPRLAAINEAALPAQARRQELAAAVEAQMLTDLVGLGLADFAAGLTTALESGRCLLVLDGLDEVPQELRQRVRQTVAAVIQLYRAERIIVTCRVRSYVGPAQLPDFAAHTIAPFNADKIRNFARAWYAAQVTLGRLNREQAEAKADNLAGAALADELAELASNPMLLTTMALIHQRDIGLPRERVRLYSLAVEVLLRRWQKQKVGEAELAPSPALTAFLKDEHRLRPVLERLAYDAHRAGRGNDHAADLPRGAALTLLEEPEYLGHPGLAAEFLDYVDQRSGLLVGRGGDLTRPTSYSFPHRTFQEYLAGCYIISRRNVAREVYSHAAEGDYWALAVQLGAEELLYNLRRQNDLLDLMYGLCGHTPPTGEQSQRVTLWAGSMAALVGRGVIERDSDSPEGGPAYLARQIPYLVQLLGEQLPPPERLEAGDALAALGDPRDFDELIEIPAGPFVMGDDNISDDEKSQHELALPAYTIGKYPVTNRQFAAFIEAGGYREKRWWTAAGWQERQRGDWIEPRHWRNSRFNAANRPVVGVSWYEAVAYCRWLEARIATGEFATERMTADQQQLWANVQSKIQNRKSKIALPSEAEWEKAARGVDGRDYPWGNRWDKANCNTSESQLGQTSPVGMVPAGASPYGVLEMAGNVWEWCSTVAPDRKLQRYPFRITNEWTEEYLEGTDVRSVRGGSWGNSLDDARCASRYRYYPLYRINLQGFRIIVSPISPASGL